MRVNANLPRIGISARVSIITILLLVAVFTIMLIVLGERLNDDIHDVQVQGFKNEVTAVKSLVNFQTRQVERILQAHTLNPAYADSLLSEDFSGTKGLLRILHSNLQILDATLLVDTKGTVVAAAEDSHVGASLTGTDIWRQIESGGAYPADHTPSASLFSGEPVVYNAVRILHDREELGTLVAVMDLGTFNALYVSPLAFGESGYPFLMTRNGRMVGYPDRDLIGEDMAEEDFYKQIDGILQQSGSQEDMVTSYTFNGERRMAAFAPILGLDWVVGVTMTADEMQAPARAVIRMLVVSGVIAAIVMIAALIAFIHLSLIRRIHAMAEILQTASTGNLSVASPEKGGDEFSDISRRFNRLMMSLRGLIHGVREKMNVLESGGHDLSANVQQTAAAINQINANIESTRSQIANQSVSISETSATIEQMTKNIESLGNSIEHQAESVTQSSTAVEEMVQSVRVIGTTTEKASREVRSLEDVTKNGKQQLDKMVALIRDISGMSDALGEANTVIAAIASQTNLLAMNAAIEAAHAGEAGAGFSVVADEIRNLAENASGQAKIVKGRLKDVTQAVQSIVEISGETDSAFGRITGSIDGVQRVFEEIRSAMQEQSAGGEQLLGILSGMTRITDTVRSGSEEMNQGNAQILEVITGLNSISQEVKNAIEEIARGTGEINRAVSNIVELSDENTLSIGQVHEETRRFFLTEEEVLAAQEAQTGQDEKE